MVILTNKFVRMLEEAVEFGLDEMADATARVLIAIRNKFEK